MRSTHPLQWFTMCVFALSSATNYLDRLLLSALAPTLMAEFTITPEQFGWLASIFSIPYALSSPVMGLFLDRVGLRWGASALVGAWSLAGMSTGFVSTFPGLLACRAALGFAESGGIPATGKAAATYLPPKDRALGSAISQVGLTIGSMLAPPVFATWIAGRYGWRMAFVAAGALGLLWIPLWLWTSRRAPIIRFESDPVRPPAVRAILADRRFQGLIAANILAMTMYSLWTIWSTLFLVQVHGLSQDTANVRYAWIPPIFATLGGLFGGWLAQRAIAAGGRVMEVRMRLAWLGGALCLATAAAPHMPNAGLSTAAICLSFFSVTCLSVNYYAIPLDIFGAQRAAFGVSFLTSAFGLMQVFLSPLIGRWCVAIGWAPVCAVIAGMPLLSVLLLRQFIPREP